MALGGQETRGAFLVHQEDEWEGYGQVHEDQAAADDGVECNGTAEVDAAHDEDDEGIGY